MERSDLPTAAPSAPYLHQARAGALPLPAQCLPPTLIGAPAVHAMPAQGAAPGPAGAALPGVPSLASQGQPPPPGERRARPPGFPQRLGKTGGARTLTCAAGAHGALCLASGQRGGAAAARRPGTTTTPASGAKRRAGADGGQKIRFAPSVVTARTPLAPEILYTGAT